MTQGYFYAGKAAENVTFDYFFRINPFNGGFLVYTGEKIQMKQEKPTETHKFLLSQAAKLGSGYKRFRDPNVFNVGISQKLLALSQRLQQQAQCSR